MTKNITLKTILLYVTLGAFLNWTVSCSYFQVQKVQETNHNKYEQQLQQQYTMNKFFILHNGNQTYAMYDIMIDTVNNKIRSLVNSVPDVHQYFDSSQHRISNGRYIQRKEGALLNEIHIYASSLRIDTVPSTIEIPSSAITQIDIINKDKGRTTTSYVFGILGGGVVGLLIILAIAAATSSCPFIYVDDGTGYSFYGEIFGGAIYPSLERDDYLPLPPVTVAKDQYRIQIANELQENQHTNLAELWYIQHEKGTTVLADKGGKIHTISDSRGPLSASLNDKIDCMNEVMHNDSLACLFNDTASAASMNELHLSFSKPAEAVEGKLVLRAKNSLWLDYLYGKFLQLFGSYYNTWARQQKKIPPSDHNSWSISQGIPMLVSLKTDGGWQCIDTVPAFGPLAWRDLIVPVDLHLHSASAVEIKLSCGFMFWEVDYAAMDFSPEGPYQLMVIKPSSAIDEKGLSERAQISESDRQYLDQPVPGCITDVTYNLPERKTGDTFSIVLHARGYYELIRDFKGIPDFAYLKTFKKEGAFSNFSKEQYTDIFFSIISAKR